MRSTFGSPFAKQSDENLLEAQRLDHDLASPELPQRTFELSIDCISHDRKHAPIDVGVDRARNRVARGCRPVEHSAPLAVCAPFSESISPCSRIAPSSSTMT
jgi:hypothetical protein